LPNVKDYHMPKIFLSIIFLLVTGCAVGQMNPQYIAFVGGSYSGAVNRGAFLAQEGVGGQMKMTEHHWIFVTVKTFQIIAWRDSLQLFTYKNIGNVFEASLKTKLKELQIGDRILIFDIWAAADSEKTVFLQPLEYILK
jgi:hypothetical protein